MSRESNISAQERFGAAVNSGAFSAFNDVVAPGAIDHDPAPGQAPGPEGFRQFLTQFRTAFPDLHIEVEQMVADADKVAIAYTATGTHQGDLMGFAACKLASLPTANSSSAGAVPINWGCCSN